MARPISNLCASLDQPEGSCCGYLAEENCRYYVYTIARHSADSFRFITLDQILRGEVVPQPTRSQRYTLSLIIASSFLQLLDSAWMPTSFRKTDLLFLTDGKDQNVFLLDQPYVTRDFAVQLENSATTATEKQPVFSDSLDYLAIILLELCFGKILEEQPSRKRWPAGGDKQEKAAFDVLAAREWHCSVNGEAGFNYAEAVGWCLGGNRSTPQDRWRQDMLRNVIQPLKQCCDYLDSGGTLLLE